MLTAVQRREQSRHVARLAGLHLILHPAVGALLDQAPTLLRRLGSTTTRATESGLAGVRGPVDWPATGRVRLLERTPTVVTHPGAATTTSPRTASSRCSWPGYATARPRSRSAAGNPARPARSSPTGDAAPRLSPLTALW